MESFFDIGEADEKEQAMCMSHLSSIQNKNNSNNFTIKTERSKLPKILLKISDLKNSVSFFIENDEDHKCFLNETIFKGRKQDENDGEEAESLTEPQKKPNTYLIGGEKFEKIKPSEYYINFVCKTEEECTREALSPQKSAGWLAGRKNCITASQFGAAAGLNPYQTPEQLLKEKLWCQFQGNAATEWGNRHEDHARECFKRWFFDEHPGAQFEEVNMLKFSEEPWIAVSPDGLVHYVNEEGKKCTDLIEYKCPAYLRNTEKHPYAKHPANTPPYYMAQMQGIMGLINKHHKSLKIERCWFVVWQPRQTWICYHNFDNAYFLDLYEKLKEWYFGKYLVALTHKYNGCLEENETFPRSVIVL